MRRHSAFLAAGVLLLISGCDSLPFLSGGDELPVVETPGEQPPTSVETADTPTEGETGELFEDPIVPEVDGNLPDLIQATNPDDRLQAIQAGRANPFNTAEVPFKIEQPEIQLPPAPSSSPVEVEAPLITLPPPVIVPDPESLEPDFTLPDPTLAKAVQVMGVVEAGSMVQAIVRAPLDVTSRYVSVGQRIADGQVLVKQIDLQGSEPTVILEELGVEVVKFIGQPTEAS